MEVRTLKTRFGNALAKQILQEKKQQEENKDPSDSLTYWMKHPDVAQEVQQFKKKCFSKPWGNCHKYLTCFCTQFLLQDFEMVRMFDSMVYEDEVTDDLSLGLTATGELDGAQTRQAMCLACIYVETWPQKNGKRFSLPAPVETTHSI